MRVVFALVLAGLLFLGFGCPSEEEAPVEAPPLGEVPGEAPEEVPEEELPPDEPGEITECEDGTLLGECSEEKPLLCDMYGSLVYAPQVCGCPENSLLVGNECIHECEDGTLIEECSEEQPYYCSQNARLEERASICGCPPGYDAHGETCRNACEDGTLRYSCSTANPPYYCGGDYELVLNPPVCGCHPWEFLLGEECFDPSAREYSLGETVWINESLSMKVEDVEWENCDGYVYVRMRLTFANEGSESVEMDGHHLGLFVNSRKAAMHRPSGCVVGSMFSWSSLRPGETRVGRAWFRVTGGTGDLRAEYLHYYTPTVLKKFHINLEEDR